MLTRHQSQIALGSQVVLVLVCDNEEKAVECFRQLWLHIFEFERQFSRFLPASELSQFNRAAGLRQPISPEFYKLLQAVKKMASLTNGLYNPFILPALQRAGYTHSMVAAHRHDSVDDFSNRSVTQPDALELSDTWASIPYGTAIDVGGCGKGYIGDDLAQLAETFDLSGYWFSLGGDVIAGGTDQNGEPWIVQVESTTKPAAIAGKVVTSSSGQCAVATSSTTQRKGLKNGKAWHHLIDPRTSTPAATDICTASVSAGSALIADTLASCAVILGSRQAPAFVNTRGAGGGLLQTKSGKLICFGDMQKH